LKGIYVLVIKVERNIDIDVGALGTLNFRGGLYAYVGSAQINLGARLNRHMREGKHKFWHIDYLLGESASRIVKTFVTRGNKTYECVTARRMAEEGNGVDGFGCSDCDCQSHLIQIGDYRFLLEFMKEFERARMVK